MQNNLDLIDKIKSYNRFFNKDTLSKAYEFAVNAHKYLKRKSGDPFVNLPLAVLIVALISSSNKICLFFSFGIEAIHGEKAA